MELPASDASHLKEQCRKTNPPAFNVINNTLSAWQSYKGSQATFAALTRVLYDLNMADSQQRVEKYTNDKNIAANSPVQRTHIVDLSRELSEDNVMNHQFLQFLGKLEIPNSRRFPIEKDFTLVYESGPFYNVVAKCLDIWKSRKGLSATNKALEEALNQNRLTDQVEHFRLYCKNKYSEKQDGNKKTMEYSSIMPIDGKDSGTSMDLSAVVSILVEDSHFCNQWERFAAGLGIRPQQLSQYRQYKEGTAIKFDALLKELIERWININPPSNAPLRQLSCILEEQGFHSATDKLMALAKLPTTFIPIK